MGRCLADIEAPLACSVVECMVMGRCVLVTSCCTPGALTDVAFLGVGTSATGWQQAGRETCCKGIQLAHHHPTAAPWKAGRLVKRACVRSIAVCLHTMPLLLAGMRACLCHLGTGSPGKPELE